MEHEGHDLAYDGWEYDPIRRQNVSRFKCKICRVVFVGGTKSIGCDYDFNKEMSICKLRKGEQNNV